MTLSDDPRPPPARDRSPWWAAAAGSGGIIAAVLQDHAIAWAIVAAFGAWLVHDVIISWIMSKTDKRR